MLKFAAKIPERHDGMLVDHARGGVAHHFLDVLLCTPALAMGIAVFAIVRMSMRARFSALDGQLDSLPAFSAKTTRVALYPAVVPLAIDLTYRLDREPIFVWIPHDLLKDTLACWDERLRLVHTQS